MCRARTRTSVSWLQAGVHYAVTVSLINWFSLFCGTAPPFNELPEKGKTKSTLFLFVEALASKIIIGKVPSVPKF